MDCSVPVSGPVCSHTSTSIMIVNNPPGGTDISENGLCGLQTFTVSKKSLLDKIMLHVNPCGNINVAIFKSKIPSAPDPRNSVWLGDTTAQIDGFTCKPDVPTAANFSPPVMLIPGETYFFTFPQTNVGPGTCGWVMGAHGSTINEGGYLYDSNSDKFVGIGSGLLSWACQIYVYECS